MRRSVCPSDPSMRTCTYQDHNQKSLCVNHECPTQLQVRLCKCAGRLQRVGIRLGGVWVVCGGVGGVVLRVGKDGMGWVELILAA